MNNHTITIQSISSYSDRTPSEDHQAECACGWVSNRSWLKATALRAADNHMAAIMPPTAWNATLPTLRCSTRSVPL